MNFPCTIAVIGDSYSDIGNAYMLTDKSYPTQSYSHGRYSNGPIYVEHVANSLNCSIVNYAYGGSTLNNTRVQGYTGQYTNITVPSLDIQMQHYKSTLHSANFTIIHGGANDYFFNSNTTHLEVYHSLMQLANVASSNNDTKIILFTILDPLLVPYCHSNQREICRKWSESIHLANELLKASNYKCHIFDINQAISTISHQFNDTAQYNCMANGNINCDSYLFFDVFHLSAKAHLLLANLILSHFK
eukprot:NODE_1316_length_1361_cov_0.267829.p1 type:complete len:246 gc:universal NODE_1316_length_1361_cov_0.267829:86-823(+)